MIKRYAIVFAIGTLALFMISGLFAQPADGENEYRLAEVNPRNTGTDTLDSNAGRGIWVAHDPDLDGDGLPEIIVTEYGNGGRVFVFEMIGDDMLEFVWASKILEEGRSSTGGGSTPRSVTTGDFDNNGRQEIVFQIGFNPNDSTEAANRGIYFYEWTGQDNDYGTEPIFKMTFESIDSSFAGVSVGRTEAGLRIQDIDGDGKAELLFPPRAFNFNVAKLYIMQVESGTFADGNAVIENEYVYEGMVMPPIFGGTDGYVPVGTDIGDIDNDGLDEIIVAGWRNIGAGAGLGFIQINGPDSYTDGSVVSVADFSAFVVKGKPIFANVNGEPVIYLHGTNAGVSESQMWIMTGIISEQFVDASNISELFPNVGFWSAWDMGDQDHATGGDGDGLDFYLYGGSGRLLNIEYNGSGALTDTSSYTITQVVDLLDTYDNIGGLFNDVYARPGLDLDGDGLRDFVASYKGSGVDSLNGEPFTTNSFNIFFFEWGDSTASKDLITSVPRARQLTIITPDDFILEQNYPNPFNPTTSINFTLPLDKTISLKIYNSLGQEVRTLADNESYSKGSHAIQWDATDASGSRVASGVYIYKLVFGNFSKSMKMTLVR